MLPNKTEDDTPSATHYKPMTKLDKVLIAFAFILFSAMLWLLATVGKH